MATKRSNLAMLAEHACHYGRATASDGRWQAWQDTDGLVYVRHYARTMVAISPTTGEVIGLDRGYGSMTDKCGIGRILRGFRANVSTYREVFDGVTA